ncbi:NEL-type E3 ubiquitin ligase domain-containing protein [Pseudomonas sp. B14(2022)]|uniref:NEL-type E3 ubiquitin ligase domain-containing protein n=1 Tax=Pseudomonas sp. B14(2022) TaxID=2914043 RepID=UPI0014322561|nr:NEL-type E3 ubiquitin ligase domain-containing protein [Pseudomonas sp. B14(2022)]NJJ57621.1 hypothetical protein [Pseudomonas sp. B14(2022)]
MTDNITAPPADRVSDAQSPHLSVIRDNIPDWYTEAQGSRKAELASLDLRIPDWYKKASQADRDRLGKVHKRSRASLNQLDQMLGELKPPAEYAEPLLADAIEKKFGQRLDTRKVFYARKLEQTTCDAQLTEVSTTRVSELGPQFYSYKGVSLLEAALNNFAPEQASEPVCKDCHLITRYDFYRHSSAQVHPSANVQSLKLDIQAHAFAQLCRELDLGRSYYEYLRAAINHHLAPGTQNQPAGKLFSSLIISHQNQLELAADIALMKGDIQPAQHQLINDVLVSQSSGKWSGHTVKFSPLRLCNLYIENILIIGPVEWRVNIRNAQLLPMPCMVYIPGDPLHPLKSYDHIAAFTDHLTTRLCRDEYRKFFSQFVPLAHQDSFFTRLKVLLDPGAAHAEDQDFVPANKARITDQGTYGVSWSDVWMDCATQRIRLIMNNASTAVVSTQSKNDQAYNAWLWSWGSTALDILNLASFVVPFLGEAMLVVAAVQMVYEIGEGIEAWSEGDTRTAWAHFSAVGLDLAGLAVPKVLMAAKDTAFIKRLVHVEFGGRTRLHSVNPGQYLHRIALPEGLRPNAQGLYAHEGGLYLPATDGGHYKVVTGAEGESRLLHPDGDSRYAPRIHHNGMGAWVHEFEQPLTWDRKTLLRRIGHTVDHLSDSQLEQARLFSGVSDDELRQVFIEHRAPPPLFRDMLRRFECDAKHQAFIDRLSSPDPNVFSRVNWFMQVKLLIDNGMWPESRVLIAFDSEGNLTWLSGKVRRPRDVVKLQPEQLGSGVLFPAMLNQLTEGEIRQLLDEDEVEQEIHAEQVMLGIITRGERSVDGKPTFAEERMAQLMRAQRTPAARAARYRDRLLTAAKNTRNELFNLEMSAGDISSDVHVQWLQRSFPSLPKLAAEEIVAHARPEELARCIEPTSRLPLRLAEEARRYAQKARVMRAHADLLFDNPLTMDGVHLALHKLAAIPGQLEGVCIELRADTYEGAVLDRVGDATAPRQLRLIRSDMKEWMLYSVPQQRLYCRSDKDAFFSALWFASGGQFTHRTALLSSTQALKGQLGRLPLSEQASRRALGLQTIRPGFKSPMRLADGRIGYPLSPVGRAAQRPFVCTMKAMVLYPSKSLAEVETLLGLQGAADAVLLARLAHLETEFFDLNKALVNWQEEESGYASARRRVSATINEVWQRGGAQAFAGDGTPIGHVLDLSEEAVGELPAITANMDHVGHLKLRRMGLSDRSLPFLQAFGGLRWLNLSENNFTQLPALRNGGAGLTKLNLKSNDIQLTEQSRTRLESMQQLKILNLGHNRRLGWSADVSRLRELNQLYLPNTGTTRFPVGVERLPALARIDLHANQITTLPEYAYQHRERINVHENPLSAATLARLQMGEPLMQWGEHVTVDEARDLWLGEPSAAELTRRGGIWDELRSIPESAAFFTVLADTTRSAEYASAVTRPSLAQRVWDMLEAASESQAIRESLFTTADDRVTCGDGSSVEFMNLESELMGARALEMVGTEHVEGSLIATGRKLFRLTLVDAIAQRDVEARGPGFTEQVEVILAYRTLLADRLELPVKSREMLFPQQANVSQAAIDGAYAQVLRDERNTAAEETFLTGRLFWETHLRSRYPQELKALMTPELDLIDEKSTALFELSDLQGEQVSAADQATKDQWQAMHDQVTDRLAGLLGRRRDEILVNGAMQSAFFESELKQLGVERQALEQRSLRILTRRVLNNFAATQGTPL